MVYTAHNLLGRLKHLTLVGQDEDGDLEFIGSDGAWIALMHEEDGVVEPDCDSYKDNLENR